MKELLQEADPHKAIHTYAKQLLDENNDIYHPPVN
jgi:hypothetical protein